MSHIHAFQVKTLNSKKSKAPYKSSQEIDNQITYVRVVKYSVRSPYTRLSFSKLTKQVETGSMKLVDEKKALNEISSLRRVRKTVEDFQAEQDSIDADRKELDELRKQLDDPEVKAASERFDKIKAELDELKKESDVAYGSRNQLYDERKQCQERLDELWSRKKEAQAVYRQESDMYYQQVKEDRAKRAEKQLAQKKAEEVEKKKAHAEQLLDDARHPAFAAEILDCQTLVDYFSVKTGAAEATTSSSLHTKNEVAGAPKLELRQVDSTGLVLKKKKGEAEENYFVAKRKQPVPKKGASTAVPAPPKENNPSSSSQQLQLPFGTLSGLLALSIPPPVNAGDVPRVIEDLKTKKAWFQANRTCFAYHHFIGLTPWCTEARVTQENIAKAEAQIAKLEKGKEGQETTADAVEEAETAGPTEVAA